MMIIFILNIHNFIINTSIFIFNLYFFIFIVIILLHFGYKLLEDGGNDEERWVWGD